MELAVALRSNCLDGLVVLWHYFNLVAFGKNLHKKNYDFTSIES
jgi:hypothetical protein